MVKGRSAKLLFRCIMNYQTRDWDDIIIVSLVQLNAFYKNIILLKCVLGYNNLKHNA